MDYMSAQEAATKWRISKRRVQTLCRGQRVRDAGRIGNMWVIPSFSEKPVDARRKEKEESVLTSQDNIKRARNKLKLISLATYQRLCQTAISREQAQMQAMAVYAAVLLRYYCGTGRDEKCLSQSCEFAEVINFMHRGAKGGCDLDMPPALTDLLASEYDSFIRQYSFCLDDSLSWSYQYVSKKNSDTELAKTQFATEKYMVAALVESSRIQDSDGKIFDPACGGGNFLLYALGFMCNRRMAGWTSEEEVRQGIDRELSRLYGYELDSGLALVAAINLKLKALAMLRECNVAVSEKDWIHFRPNIFYSKSEGISGFLDLSPERHQTVQVGEQGISTLSEVERGSRYILTNPPFETVKRMSPALKCFLKRYYPLAKCDLCNAFIQHSIETVMPDGVCCLVTQSSWMYLDSFSKFRSNIRQSCSIPLIVELGSNAFYDISGEKTSVSLIEFKKEKTIADSSTTVVHLRDLSQKEKMEVLCSGSDLASHSSTIPQGGFTDGGGDRMDLSGVGGLSAKTDDMPTYSKFATPMQGTSTGNAAELIDYRWRHLGDPEWVSVSKAGGYSRWNGLNIYVLKWGLDGEYIRRTKGSALRNAKYFDETELVFSDTGTSGLNVRLLKSGQLFVASGPGIRIGYGDKYAHMCLLNSRLASFYLKSMTPKLTVAPGYISKIPAQGELLTSAELGDLGRRCYSLKTAFLSKRPLNDEFAPVMPERVTKHVTEQAKALLCQDVVDEYEKLSCEYQIDTMVLDAYGFSRADKNKMAGEVGHMAMEIDNYDEIGVQDLDTAMASLLDSNCTLRRTRVSKSWLGCDGVLEYLAEKENINPQALKAFVLANADNLPLTVAKYVALYLHSLVLTMLNYGGGEVAALRSSLPLLQLRDELSSVYSGYEHDYGYIMNWIRLSFSDLHLESFVGHPLYRYDRRTDALVRVRDN